MATKFQPEYNEPCSSRIRFGESRGCEPLVAQSTLFQLDEAVFLLSNRTALLNGSLCC